MKQYTIIQSHTKRESREVTGTIEELTRYYSYTLEIGNSWNRKINRNPKTIASLVKNIQAAFEEKESSCYERTFVNLKK